MVFGKWMVYLITVLAAWGMLLVYPAAAENDASVSPALEILAEQCTVAMSESDGREIGFEANDFEKALNLSRISSIKVTSLPERSDGILYLGDSEVREGQVISRANISYMKFVFMNEEVRDTSFCFSTNLGTYDIPCSLYRLEYENLRPTVSVADDLSLTVGTYRDITVYGKMDAYDPDGDQLVFEIVDYPEHGLLIVTDSNSGDYKYIPDAGYTGNDSFRYVVVDRYGSYSSSAEVCLNVTQQSNALVYRDLEDHASHVAAISLTEQGIIASSALDGQYYFNPEARVTRAEFLVMAMKTLGIDHLSGEEKSVFSDDEDISDEHRGYVNAAQKLGYICGKINGDGQLVFAPNDGITRAEAATILQNMTSFAVPVIKPLFLDLGTVPAWAKDAVYALTSSGIMTYSGGYVSADSVVSKAQCAEMLYRLALTRG